MLSTRGQRDVFNLHRLTEAGGVHRAYVERRARSAPRQPREWLQDATRRDAGAQVVI